MDKVKQALSVTADPTLSGHKVMVCQPWKPKDSYLQRLKEAHPGLEVVCYATKHVNTEEMPKNMPADVWKDVTALLTYKVFPTVEQAPKLQYVQLTSAGCNHIIDNPLFVDTDVAFCTANGTHPPQIAELVFTNFLAFQHHVPMYYDAMKSGNWIESENDEDVEDAVGLRCGILGYGCIGRQCARIAKALGMDVVVFNRTARPDAASRRDESYTEPGMGDPEGIFPSAWYSGETMEAVNDFLSQQLDLLIIAMPLTKLTRNMIAAPQFAILASQKHAYVCNIGRGPIVNTEDLMEALDRGDIRGAALDVTDPEPLPKDHPLWSKKNLIITPHTSGNSTHYNDRVLAIMEYNLQRISEGKAVVNRVDRVRGY